MMGDYIEREAVMTMLHWYEDYDCPATNEAFGVVDSIRNHISKIKAADVAPVVHGEWLLRREGVGHYWECSVCHKSPCIYVTKDTKYCPNCGAKMDEGNHET